MKRPPIVIVGASLAGGTAAVTLREEGYDGDIVLIGAERELPYSRPPLSKGYLRGQDRFEDQLVKPGSYYTEQRIQLKLGVRATAIDAAQKVVELEGGERVVYDRLLVTTGGRNRTLTVPGANLSGVFQLRTVQDCDHIRAAVSPGRRAVVIGFSFIGSEVSASLRQLGVEVVAIEGARVPLARVLGDEVGRVLADIHHDKGVQLVSEDAVDALEGSDRVTRVRTRKNRVFDCDLVVAGIGIVPNAELLAAAGTQIDNGVLVDEHCRTSLPDVFAAGDVTNHLHPVFGRLRVEHWNNGYQQGRAAARSLLGRPEPYDYIHTFWSDQYEHVIEYVGFAASWDRVVFRGRPESRKFLAFYLKDGVVRAAMGLDRGGDPEDPKGESELKAAVDMVRRRAKIDPDKLADDSAELRTLVGASV
jgi:3-phenylpropionate/trans-cinnamate dioxygenase ferredoxin reductase component